MIADSRRAEQNNPNDPIVEAIEEQRLPANFRTYEARRLSKMMNQRAVEYAYGDDDEKVLVPSISRAFERKRTSRAVPKFRENIVHLGTKQPVGNTYDSPAIDLPRLKSAYSMRFAAATKTDEMARTISSKLSAKPAKTSARAPKPPQGLRSGKYPIRDIMNYHEATRQYLIDWAAKLNGDEYRHSWDPEEDVADGAIAEWNVNVARWETRRGKTN
ncbi:hypothetical protein BJ878DRAFT_477581 [Calycina marina]|uniref:Uncharacterized protein n=1 Tax=Calycina marina TaxID=1763456 RepID=A0A9P7Z8S4_9HELO|nr:hypothetical protein BJ878DRAFT_477581 [Calycina marina]